MPKKAGPSLLCEWMVGTTINSALGPSSKPSKPKPKPKKRDIIKLHVTTDDESGEDTLTITYPRSKRLGDKTETQTAASEPESASEPASEPVSEPASEPEPKPEVVEVVKKVRFEKEAAPKKSAMKKKTSVTFCEEEETKSESSADAISTSASSGEATPEASSSNASSAAETSSAGETSSDSSSRPIKASKSSRPPRSKRTEKTIQSSDSEADSEPHPTCECKECTTGRKKQRQETVCEKKKCKKDDKKTTAKKKKEIESESEPETSASEAESSADEKPTPPKKSKEKKDKKKVEVSDTEGETSESAKETEAESEKTPKKSPEKKKKQVKNSETEKKVEKKTNTPKGEGKKKTQEAKKTADEEKDAENANGAEEEKKAEENKPENTPTEKVKEKETNDTKKPETISPTSQTKDMEQKLHYPEGYHSHSRPPNLIAPIRAEVMQTERVVETQDDPPPNAYYDALHNVVRVYHGSIYGQNGHYMFGAQQNATGHPQASGVPHLMQNPYYPSYNNVMPLPPPQQQLPPHGYEHVPITQSMPMPGWNAVVPPGFPMYNYQGGPPAAWYEQQLNRQGTKGAFSMDGTPDSKEGKSKSREPDNNVMPQITKPNPYYTKRQSPFSNMGSHRSGSNGKPPSHSGNSNCSKNGGGSQRGGKDAAPNWDTSSRRSVGAWANSSNHGATWGDAAGDTNNQSGGDQWGTGGGDTWNTTNNNDQWNNTGGDQWGAGSNNGAWTGSGNDQNTQGGWDNSDNANTGGATWGDGTTNDQQQTNDNNGNDGSQGQGRDQDQGQSNTPVGGNEPTPAMVDNNVIPAAAVTGPQEEPSKMPGSWYSENDGQAAFVKPKWRDYQPPSALPEWGDPTMAASTGGMVEW